MKSRSDFSQQAQTDLFNELGVFFAFSNEQLGEQAKPDVEYVNLGAGMICPKPHAKEVVRRLDDIYRSSIAADKAAHTAEQIIERELANFECYYVGEIEDAVDALGDYGYTTEQIDKVFRDTAHRYENF